MQISTLMEKAEQGQFHLLSLLDRSPEHLPLKELCQQTSFSKITVMKYVECLNDFFHEQGLDSCIITDKDTVFLKREDNRYWKKTIALFLQDSVKFNILLFLFKKKRFTVPNLAQSLLISEATLHRHLSMLNQFLSSFDISINNGRMRGPEHAIRFFFFELFWEGWDKEQFETELSLEDYHTEIKMLERLCNVSLTEHQKEKWVLWLWVSKHRFGYFKKDFTSLEQLIAPYQENIFYQRLYQVCLRYFSQYALEFEDGEAMCVFVFLVTQFILPIQTMEYVLGFGGPVVSAVTDAIQLIRQQGLFQGFAHEQLAYHLSQWFGQKYFCSDALLLNSQIYTLDYSPYQYLVTPELEQLAQQLNHLMCYQAEPIDFNQKIEWHLLQLLLFLMDKSSVSLRVGIDIGEGFLKSDLMMSVLRHYLENTHLYQLLLFSKNQSYDCIISNQLKKSYGALSTYYINQDLSFKDIKMISRFLREEMAHKEQENTRY